MDLPDVRHFIAVDGWPLWGVVTVVLLSGFGTRVDGFQLALRSGEVSASRKICKKQ